MTTLNLFHIVIALFIANSCTNILTYARTTISSPLFNNQISTFISCSVAFSIGAILYFQTLTSTSSSPIVQPRFRSVTRMPVTFFFFIILVLLSWSFLRLPDTGRSRMHPIDALMNAALVQHEAWIQQATSTKTFGECVNEYRRRYNRHPPPGFDLWYKYAKDRSSVIIDDFDHITEDLQPFWAIKPADIRAQTREILADPWNEVAPILIRNGKAEIGPDVKPTHRWMLDGVIAIMSNYIEKIPDMDLAFNINDEPRIVIPYSDLQNLEKRSAATATTHTTAVNEFSKDRATGWNISIDSGSIGTHPFADHSFNPSFHNFGSIACHPSSYARRSRPWDPRTLCTTCLAPHSTGLFLKNWTLSASPCHQPDLPHLHGFYTSPSAFKPSTRLLPVFSQSKAAGYADIRYPSPWNYMDKAVYAPNQQNLDPPFTEKESSLFWRGATSEGLSRAGEWKAMARQRLVHLVNNNTMPQPILLPSSSIHRQNAYAYTSISPSLLPALGLNITSIALVGKINRCWDSDCPTQGREFGLADPTDFQSHWHHRYLIDLDGAGFSGRFLPFLQSRSLPFKVAGPFREWWDGRVMGT